MDEERIIHFAVVQFLRFEKQCKNTIFPNKKIGNELTPNERLDYFIEFFLKKAEVKRYVQTQFVRRKYIAKLKERIKQLKQQNATIKQRHSEEIVKAIHFGKDYKKYLVREPKGV